MAGAAILAAALTNHGARAKSLWIDGLDVLYEPISSGMPYGVHRETIHLFEAGPGAISSLTFDIVDLEIEIGVSEGSVVRFFDHSADVPLFTGFVQSWSYQPLPVGRIVSVRCIGVEALLDWLVIADMPDITFQDSREWAVVFQEILAACVHFGFPLNAAWDGLQGLSSLDTPLCGLGSTPLSGATLNVSGMTLRSALQAVIDFRARGYSDYYASLGEQILVTVDFYYGLRVTSSVLGGTPFVPPMDYRPGITIDDTIAGTVASSSFDFEVDVVGAIHRVYIKGGNAAGSGLFTDGTSLPGPTAVISDSASNNAATARGRAIAYLATRQVAVRGTVHLSKYSNPSTPSHQVRPLTQVTINDMPSGVGSYSDFISSITKTFNQNGSEEWTVTYGGNVKSGISTTRRLTRDTLS